MRSVLVDPFRVTDVAPDRLSIDIEPRPAEPWSS
jgi:hypothetical protein